MVLNLSTSVFLLVALLGWMGSFLGLKFDFSEYGGILNFTKISFAEKHPKISNLNPDISKGSNMTANHIKTPNNLSLFLTDF